jgi:hypothetical protein
MTRVNLFHVNIYTGKSYRSTEGNEFIKEINKKKQQGNPLAELKKAA